MGDLYDADSSVYEWIASNLCLQDPVVLSMRIDDFEAVVEGYEMERMVPGIAAPVLHKKAHLWNGHPFMHPLTRLFWSSTITA